MNSDSTKKERSNDIAKYTIMFSSLSVLVNAIVIPTALIQKVNKEYVIATALLITMALVFIGLGVGYKKDRAQFIQEEKQLMNDIDALHDKYNTTLSKTSLGGNNNTLALEVDQYYTATTEHLKSIPEYPISFTKHRNKLAEFRTQLTEYQQLNSNIPAGSTLDKNNNTEKRAEQSTSQKNNNDITNLKEEKAQIIEKLLHVITELQNSLKSNTELAKHVVSLQDQLKRKDSYIHSSMPEKWSTQLKNDINTNNPDIRAQHEKISNGIQSTSNQNNEGTKVQTKLNDASCNAQAKPHQK